MQLLSLKYNVRACVVALINAYSEAILHACTMPGKHHCTIDEVPVRFDIVHEYGTV